MAATTGIPSKIIALAMLLFASIGITIIFSFYASKELPLYLPDLATSGILTNISNVSLIPTTKTPTYQSHDTSQTKIQSKHPLTTPSNQSHHLHTIHHNTTKTHKKHKSKHITKSATSQSLSCPDGYTICTDNVYDIFNYIRTKNTNNESNKTCIKDPFQHRPDLFTHLQGEWLNFSDHANSYLNVTHSKSFELHRLYYPPTSQPKYMVLMNSAEACDLGWKYDPSKRIKGQMSLKHNSFHKYQCNLSLQNASVANIEAEYEEYSKWYPDNDNFIDILTGNDMYVILTDLYNQCNNERFAPRECCGQGTRIRPERWKFIWNEARTPSAIKERLSKPVPFILNVAQSRGYFHFFVESMPRLAPFIYLLKQIAMENKRNGNITLSIHVEVASISTPLNFLHWLFRKEKQYGISYGAYFHGNIPKYASTMIQPHATTCTWARARGSMLLNKILRKEIEIFAEEKGMNISKDVGRKNILMLRRHTRRKIENFDILYAKMKAKYIDKKGYNIYIHDDAHLNKNDPFKYYLEFYKADIVIGAFGAGMVNIVFSKPATPVILVQGSHHKNHRMYMAHSMALGMRYYAYYTESRWHINIDELMKVIEFYI